MESSSSAEAYVMVDGSSPSEAAHIYNRFFFGLEQNTYSNHSTQTIQSRKTNSDLLGRLFYDELLNLALANKGDENGIVQNYIDSSKYYPPKAGDAETFIELIQVIQQSSFDRIKKMSLWYYLMLDMDHQTGSSNALPFAKEIGLPRSARYAMTGYWLLDRGDYLTAVSYLVEQPDFVSKVISTISPLPYTSSSRRDTEARALAFNQFSSLVDVQSLGYEPDEAFEEARVVAICWSQGMRAAWVHCQSPVTYFWNKEDPHAFRLRLIGRILEFCFMPDSRADAIKTLLALPLIEADEELLSHAIFHPPLNVQLSAYAHAVALDILLVRKINSGQYYDAILLDQRINSTIGLAHLSREGSSDKERETLRQLRAKREGLIRNAHLVLTSVERQLLKVDLGEEDILADGERLQGERGDLEMSWEKVGESIQSEHVTPRKSNLNTTLMKPLTPLSASPAIRGEKGNDTTSEIFLSAVIQSSPKRNKMGEMPQSSTGSPLSRSLLKGSPGTGQGASLRHSTDGNRRTPSRSLLASRGEIPVSISSPLSSKRAYHLPQMMNMTQDEELQEPSRPQQNIDVNTEESAAGPYARLAEQLQDQMYQNDGDISLNSILATKSPFRTLQSTTQIQSPNRQTSMSIAKPVHRYKATYEIDEAAGEKQMAHDMSKGEEIAMEVDDVPRRRGATKPARKGRGKAATNKVAESEADDDDASVPGSFPARISRATSQTPVKEEVTALSIPSPPPPSSIKRQMSRRVTRQSVAPAESQDDEDEVPEMFATPTMKKSRSAAALSRSRSVTKMASTPIRRSARLSVEPEGTPQAITVSPAKERRNKRGASKGPSLASASEREETENEETTTVRSTRSRRAIKMPGSF